jgi:hypothetical protein
MASSLAMAVLISMVYILVLYKSWSHTVTRCRPVKHCLGLEPNAPTGANHFLIPDGGIVSCNVPLSISSLSISWMIWPSPHPYSMLGPFFRCALPVLLYSWVHNQPGCRTDSGCGRVPWLKWNISGTYPEHIRNISRRHDKRATGFGISRVHGIGAWNGSLSTPSPSHFPKKP